MQTPRRLYNAEYRNDLETDVTTQSDDPTNSDVNAGATSEDGLTPEEKTFKQRYGDLRSHNNSLTERIKSLETQLSAAQKQDFKLPSTQAELQHFAQQYPDVVRHIRSLAMQELLQERENIASETKIVKDDLDKIRRERGLQKVLQAHPDFNDINLSEAFHEWAQLQPKQIQDWLFEDDDPDLCIKALDLFKVETNFKQKRPVGRPRGVDIAVSTRGSVEVSGEGGKRIWKGSDISKLKPREYEKLEAEIELARTEGRIDMSA